MPNLYRVNQDRSHEALNIFHFPFVITHFPFPYDK